MEALQPAIRPTQVLRTFAVRGEETGTQNLLLQSPSKSGQVFSGIERACCWPEAAKE
jgi:hypothetical protein